MAKLYDANGKAVRDNKGKPAGTPVIGGTYSNASEQAWAQSVQNAVKSNSGKNTSSTKNTGKSGSSSNQTTGRSGSGSNQATAKSGNNSATANQKKDTTTSSTTKKTRVQSWSGQDSDAIEEQTSKLGKNYTPSTSTSKNSLAPKTSTKQKSQTYAEKRAAQKNRENREKNAAAVVAQKREAYQASLVEKKAAKREAGVDTSDANDAISQLHPKASGATPAAQLQGYVGGYGEDTNGLTSQSQQAFDRAQRNRASRSKRETMQAVLGDSFLGGFEHAAGSQVAGIGETIAVPGKVMNSFLNTLDPDNKTNLRGMANALENNFVLQAGESVVDAADAHTAKGQRWAKDNTGLNLATQFSNAVGYAAVMALESYAFAALGGGASAAGSTTASLDSTAAASLGNTSKTALKVANGLKSFAKDPNTWTSFFGTFYDAYKSNVEDGASDSTALTSAALTAAINAKIETGSGYQALDTADVTSPAWQRLIRSAVEEGSEEVIQDAVERTVNAITYKNGDVLDGQSVQQMLTSMLQEFGMGTAVGGIMSGGQMAVNSAIGRASTRNAATRTNTETNTDIAENTNVQPEPKAQTEGGFTATPQTQTEVNQQERANVQEAFQPERTVEDAPQVQTAADSIVQEAPQVQTAPETITRKIPPVQTEAESTGTPLATEAALFNSQGENVQEQERGTFEALLNEAPPASDYEDAFNSLVEADAPISAEEQRAATKKQSRKVVQGMSTILDSYVKDAFPDVDYDEEGMRTFPKSKREAARLRRELKSSVEEITEGMLTRGTNPEYAEMQIQQGTEKFESILREHGMIDTAEDYDGMEEYYSELERFRKNEARAQIQVSSRRKGDLGDNYNYYRKNSGMFQNFTTATDSMGNPKGERADIYAQYLMENYPGLFRDELNEGNVIQEFAEKMLEAREANRESVYRDGSTKAGRVTLREFSSNDIEEYTYTLLANIENAIEGDGTNTGQTARQNDAGPGYVEGEKEFLDYLHGVSADDAGIESPTLVEPMATENSLPGNRQTSDARLQAEETINEAADLEYYSEVIPDLLERIEDEDVREWWYGQAEEGALPTYEELQEYAESDEGLTDAEELLMDAYREQRAEAAEPTTDNPLEAMRDTGEYDPNGAMGGIKSVGAAGGSNLEYAPTQNVATQMMTETELANAPTPDHVVVHGEDVRERARKSMEAILDKVTYDVGITETLRGTLESMAEQQSTWTPEEQHFALLALDLLGVDADMNGDWSTYRWWNAVQAQKGGTEVAQSLQARAWWSDRYQSVMDNATHDLNDQLEGGTIDEAEYNRKLSEAYEMIEKLRNALENQTPADTDTDTDVGTDTETETQKPKGQKKRPNDPDNNDPSELAKRLFKKYHVPEGNEQAGENVSEGISKLKNAEAGNETFIDVFLEVAKKRKVIPESGAFGREYSKIEKKVRRFWNELTVEEQEQKCISAIMAYIGDTQTVSVGNKLRTLQVLSHLSSLGTIGRNLTGNLAMTLVDTISTDGAALADRLVAKATGTRSVAAEKPFALNMAVRAARSAYIDIAMDIASDSKSRYDNTDTWQGGSRQSFKFSSNNPVERFLASWERTLDQWLVRPDEFFKGSTMDQQGSALRGLKDGAINEEATRVRMADGTWKTVGVEDTISALSSDLAKYRTFQSDSAMADATIEMQRALNKLPGADWGYILMPYAQVPANLANVIVEYSPVNSLRGMGQLLRLMVNQKSGNANRAYGKNGEISTVQYQQSAVLNLSRGMVGTLLAALGYGLASCGALEYDDDDASAKLNLSKIPRNIMEAMGFDVDNPEGAQEGDLLLNTAFLQPVNGIFALGAAAERADEAEGIAATLKNPVARAFVNGELAALGSLNDSPLFSSLYNLSQDINYAESDDVMAQLAEAAANEVSSNVSSAIVPNPLRAIARGLDNTKRDLYSGELATGGLLSTSLSNIMSGIPGLRQQLPEKVDNWGNTVKYNDTGNSTLDSVLTFANAAITPWSVNSYNSSDAADEIARVQDAMSEDADYNIAAPSGVKKVSQKGTEYSLTYEQRQQYKRTQGQTYKSLIEQAMRSDYYKSADANLQGEILSNARTYAKYVAQAEAFDSLGVEYDNSTYRKMKEVVDSGVSIADYTKYDAMSENMGSDAEKESDWTSAVIKQYGATSEKAVALVKTFNGYSVSDTTEWTDKDDEEHTFTAKQAEEARDTYAREYLSMYSSISSRLSGLDEDTLDDVLYKASDYAMEVAKSEALGDSYEAESIVEKVDALDSVGLDLVDYTDWNNTITGYNGQGLGDGKKPTVAIAIADSDLSEEQKKAVYSYLANYDDADSVDLTDGTAALSSTVTESAYKKMAKYVNATGHDWSEYFKLREAVSDFCSKQSWKRSGEKAAVVKQYNQTALYYILPDYDIDASNYASIYNILYG